VKNEFSICKAEEESVTVAAPTDGNAADGNSDRQSAGMSSDQCTSISLLSILYNNADNGLLQNL
jgi:hypothetical protein